MSKHSSSWISCLGLPSLVVVVLVIQGCSSAPIHYYTLVPIKVAAQGGAPVEVLIDRVEMPPQVDRAQMVVRQGSSGLAILETQWWGANLTDELRNALANQLPAIGSGGPGRSTLHLTMDVQRFDSVPGQYALIEAKWRLRSRDTSVRMDCYSRLSTPSGNTIEDLVAAHQANVSQLSSLIETAARSGRCPGA